MITKIENSDIHFSQEEELVHFLFLNASEMSDLGIYNGRMKAIMFFFSLFKNKSNETYENFSFELLEELYDLLNLDIALDFQSGLCGIGWTIEYLIKNKYLAVDEDLCGKFDKRISCFLQSELYKGVGLRKGLTGQLLYWIARLNNSLAITNKQTLACCHLSVEKILSEYRIHIDQVLSTMKEVDNKEFTIYQLFIYSEWEYPMILWSLGECVRLSAGSARAVGLLGDLIKPLCVENMPVVDVNRRLLLFALCSLKKLNILHWDTTLTFLIDYLESCLKQDHLSEKQTSEFSMKASVEDFNS